MSLPTKGRVVVETTVGELDIELWSKETPKACRNFIALAMEGYYDGVIFHRVVPGFLVQTGDKTGTGGGGESFYGEPFEDEIHPRLRYAHRGLVGMANNGTKDSNDSQFFITLDRADELQGRHTLFGRCVGDTIFNAMKIGSMELDGERPLYPPKIKTVRIVDNPFPDIVPRITAAEKRAQQRAKEQAQREREEEIRRKGAKKDKKLLSFQDDEDAEEPVAFKKKNVARPDLVDNSTQISMSLDPSVISAPTGKKTKPRDGNNSKTDDVKEKKAEEASDIVGLREKYAKEGGTAESERQKQISQLEKDIRKLDAKHAGDSGSDDERHKRKKRSYLDEELAKYEKGRGRKAKKSKKGKDEMDVLARMSSFRSKLGSLLSEETNTVHDADADGTHQENPEENNENMEVDNDTDFLSHKLSFPKGNEEEVNKADREYEVIDPRQRSAQAKEEERERKRNQRTRGSTRPHRR